MIYQFKNPDDSIIKGYLQEAKTIAVVGLSSREETAAYRVSAFMQKQGYHIIPINPRYAGQMILGEKVYAELREVPFSIDIVNVFRRNEFLADVAREAIAVDAKVFWAQLGLESQEAEHILKEAGKEAIVMNRCIKVDYQKLF